MIDMLVADTGHPMTIAMWVDASLPRPGTMGLWARCGSPPTGPTATDQVQYITNASGPGTFMTLPSCGSAGPRFVRVTNVGQTARTFRMMVGSHYASQERVGMRVGVAYWATSTQMEQIRAEFRRAAWLLYGLSAGTRVIRSYRFINGAQQCDDAWPVNQTACEGTQCTVCISPGIGTAYCQTVIGLITLYGGNSPPDWRRGDIVPHEFGHCSFGNLPDRYDSNSCNGNVDIPTSQHTWMGAYQDNAFMYSIGGDHRQTAINWDLGRSQQGPQQIACNGTWTPTASSTSDWDTIGVSGAPVAFNASFQTQGQNRMVPYWYLSGLGRFDRLE